LASVPSLRQLIPERFRLIVEHGVVRGIEGFLGGASGGLILVEHAKIHRPPSARQKTLQQALTSLPIMGKNLGTRVRTQEPRRAGVIERGFSLAICRPPRSHPPPGREENEKFATCCFCGSSRCFLGGVLHLFRYFPTPASRTWAAIAADRASRDCFRPESASDYCSGSKC
jgi:hypothetical protein